MDEVVDYVKELCKINNCRLNISWMPKGWEVEVLPFGDSPSIYFFENKSDDLPDLLCVAVQQLEYQGAQMPQGERVWESLQWANTRHAEEKRQRYKQIVTQLIQEWGESESDGNELYKEAKE